MSALLGRVTKMLLKVEWFRMISELRLLDLLDAPESETLDFKQEFHTNTLDLLHDILCLVNAYADTDRALIFGVTNRPRTIVGIESDPNPKDQAMIYDLMRQSHFNRIPTIHLQEFQVQGHTVAVLTIINRPDKPFFLLKDKNVSNSSGKTRTIRAGVIYTRLGDTNTPLADTAPDDKIELMWRERFGIGLSPLERFYKLLDEPSKWVSQPGHRDVFHHEQFPEFTIVRNDDAYDREQFSEEWCEDKFPDISCHRYEYELKYHATVLETVDLVSCDGGRYMLPLPEIKLLNESEESSSRGFYVLKSSLRYKVSNIFDQYYPLENAFARCGVELINE